MRPTRRTLLRSSLALAAATAGRSALAAAAAPRPRRILILGGTSYFGPHLVRTALERGHWVTTFTRGRTEPSLFGELFDHVEPLIGDRADDLTALEGREWDAVIDNSGHREAWTRASAALLEPRVATYLYTSSTGVYYPYVGDAIDEDTPVDTELTEAAAGDGAARYGVMKARSELAAREAFGDDRTLVARPTYVLGPGDRTPRSALWPERIARGGEVLVPGSADDPVQYVDVRDLTEWMVRAIEEGLAGTFNLCGPASRLGMHAYVHGVHAAFSSAVDWVHVDDVGFLEARGLVAAVPWILPRGANHGSARVANTRAREAGLAFRPLADTARAIHDWWLSDAVAHERRAALAEGPRSPFAAADAALEEWRRR